METITKKKEKGLPVLNKNMECNFEGYDASLLMSETAKLRNLITKRGALEILIPLCCTANPVRHKQFRQTLKGFSTRTLSIRLKELEKNGILEKHRYNEIPPQTKGSTKTSTYSTQPSRCSTQIPKYCGFYL